MPGLPSKILSVLLLLLLTSPIIARKPAPSRLFRTLVGSSNPAKLREIEKLTNRPKERDAALEDLIAAANHLAKQTPQDKYEWLPNSTLALLDLIGSSSDKAATDALINLLRSDQ